MTITVCRSPRGSRRCTNTPSADSVGRCWGSKIQLLPWSFPMRRDSAESLAGLLANNGGLSPKSNFSGMKRSFFRTAPLNNVLAGLRWVRQPARCGDSALSCAAPWATSSKLKGTPTCSLETCRFLIKGNKLKNFQ